MTIIIFLHSRKLKILLLNQYYIITTILHSKKTKL